MQCFHRRIVRVVEQTSLDNIQQETTVPCVTADTNPTLDVLLVAEWHHITMPGTESTIQTTTVLNRQLL